MVRRGSADSRAAIPLRSVILDTLELSPGELHERAGWELKPEGACKGEVCLPMPDLAIDGGTIDVADFARRLGMPLAHDERHGLWALGPQGGGKVLETVRFPDVVLSDFDGNDVDLATFRGTKMLLVVWSSY